MKSYLINGEIKRTDNPTFKERHKDAIELDGQFFSSDIEFFNSKGEINQKAYDDAQALKKLNKENEIKESLKLSAYLSLSNPLFIKWQYEKEVAELSQTEIDKLKTSWINEVKKIKSE